MAWHADRPRRLFAAATVQFLRRKPNPTNELWRLAKCVFADTRKLQRANVVHAGAREITDAAARRQGVGITSSIDSPGEAALMIS